MTSDKFNQIILFGTNPYSAITALQLRIDNLLVIYELKQKIGIIDRNKTAEYNIHGNLVGHQFAYM